MKIGDKVRIKDKCSMVHGFDSTDTLTALEVRANGTTLCEGVIDGKIGQQLLYTQELELLTPLKASTIVEYYKIYKAYLFEHSLQEDADTITVDQLVDFVENHILNS